jgi:Ca-activated chloride channel family protein
MDFTDPHFENPGRLWLAALACIAVGAVFVYAGRARRRQLAAFAEESLLARLTESHSPARRAIKHTLLLLAVALLGIALARPQWGEEQDTTAASGEDTVFVLDTSKSMLAADVRPNRLERSKLAIEDYIRRHGRGRVALVVFAGQAFLQCPLTLDYDAFSDSLRAVDVNAIPVPGSDLGRALEEAANALENNEGRKIIVLLTDGEDLVGAATHKAADLTKKGVTVFTVGVGTEAGSVIQVASETGGTQVLLDGEGRPVVSRLDEKTLTEIAHTTGGLYQRLGAVGDGIDLVSKAVADHAAANRDSIVRTRGMDRYHWPLAIALALLLAEPLLRELRRERSV